MSLNLSLSHICIFYVRYNPGLEKQIPQYEGSLMYRYDLIRFGYKSPFR